MRNLHSSFKFAEENLTFNTCYSGFSFRRLSKSIFAITSNMPSTFVVIPNKEDVKFFETAGSFNEWDRGWLSFLLKKNRVKFSGSSDLFFCVEITNENEITDRARMNLVSHNNGTKIMTFNPKLFIQNNNNQKKFLNKKAKKNCSF